MKNILLFCALFTLLSLSAQGQGGSSVWDGLPADSAVFEFAPGDSLYRQASGTSQFQIDTSNCTLWQVGGTTKQGFLAAGNPVRGIMTDTLVSYSTGQDDYFIFRELDLIRLGSILTFDHRYQTAAGKDGGFVELSSDNGTTWENVIMAQNPNGVMTDNFYALSDTITGGIPAFTGSSNGYTRSRLQLGFAIPLKGAQWGNPTLVRFRFKSDSTADTLAGWAIRRIVLENDLYPEAITNTTPSATRLSFSPNPSTNGLFEIADKAFEITPDQTYEVCNMLGRVMLSGKAQKTFDLSSLPKGLYWIQIRGKSGTATGRVLVQ